MYFFNLAIELPENTSINKYVIKLLKDKQLLYRPIYNLNLVKLRPLKIYIKTNLKTRFIYFSKSSVVAPILFDKKLNSSFYLGVNY